MRYCTATLGGGKPTSPRVVIAPGLSGPKRWFWAGGGVAWVRIAHAVIPVWEMGGRGAQQSVLEEPPAKLMHPHV